MKYQGVLIWAQRKQNKSLFLSHLQGLFISNNTSNFQKRGNSIPQINNKDTSGNEALDDITMGSKRANQLSFPSKRVVGTTTPVVLQEASGQKGGNLVSEGTLLVTPDLCGENTASQLLDHNTVILLSPRWLGGFISEGKLKAACPQMTPCAALRWRFSDIKCSACGENA